MGCYTQEELQAIGFKKLGTHVRISDKTSIYGAGNIVIGDNVRVDDFSILSGNITIGSHIHIGAGVHMFAGSAGIEIEDFVGISGRCGIYAASDDYTGEALTNPTIPDKFKQVTEDKVILKKHALIGTNSTILPGVTVEEGTATGAGALISSTTKPYVLYVGYPARPLKERKRDLLAMEREFLEEWHKQNDL